MRKIFVLLTLGMFLFSLPFVTVSKTKKECRIAEKAARYEKAKEVLKNMTFGVDPDYIKTKTGYFDLYHSQKFFFGFEENNLIRQPANFSGYFNSRAIYKVSNYIYREDDKGNVIVSFDYSGRLSNGKTLIKMKSGDNYAEVSLSIGSFNNIFTGNILPSDDIDYIVAVNTI